MYKLQHECYKNGCTVVIITWNSETTIEEAGEQLLSHERDELGRRDAEMDETILDVLRQNALVAHVFFFLEPNSDRLSSEPA